MPVHSHGDVSHDHPDAAPGHTHDTGPVEAHPTAPTAAPTEPTAPTAPVAATTPEPAPTAAAVATSSFILRAVLTAAGAAGIIGGAFLGWITAGGRTGAEGVELPVRAFWTKITDLAPGNFPTSAGLVVIVIGLVALIGLALPTGWLTRLAGALAIIAFVLFLIQLYVTSAEDTGGFAEPSVSNIGIGMWLILAGGILAVVGGFFGARPRPVAAV